MQSGSTEFRPACTGQPVFCFSVPVLDQADNSRRLVNADDVKPSLGPCIVLLLKEEKSENVPDTC